MWLLRYGDLRYGVDGTAYCANPQTLTWSRRIEPHAVTTLLRRRRQRCRHTQYTFAASWSRRRSDFAFSVTASSGTTRLRSIRFNASFQLTTAANGPAAGGTVSPASGTFYAPGTVVNLSATANTGYIFGNWTGNVASAQQRIHDHHDERAAESS